MVNRRGSLSAFGRNSRFRLVPKHFGRISLLAERALTAEMLNTAISAEILMLFRQKETTFGRKKALSAETVLFWQLQLSAKINDFWLPSWFRPKLFRLTTTVSCARLMRGRTRKLLSKAVKWVKYFHHYQIVMSKLWTIPPFKNIDLSGSCWPTMVCACMHEHSGTAGCVKGFEHVF